MGTLLDASFFQLDTAIEFSGRFAMNDPVLRSIPSLMQGVVAVPHSVLDAIRQGIWDFEPEEDQEVEFASTNAMPGSAEKLDVLSERLQLGVPLWHPRDRHTYDGRGPRED